MQFVQSVGLDQRPFHLVGTSMGGNVAGVYAATYPAHLSSVTLICPAGKLSRCLLCSTLCLLMMMMVKMHNCSSSSSLSTRPGLPHRVRVHQSPEEDGAGSEERFDPTHPHHSSGAGWHAETLLLHPAKPPPTGTHLSCLGTVQIRAAVEKDL